MLSTVNNMDNIIENLHEAGLTGNEARVYLELLKKGEISANSIAKSISMDRTLTYTVLNHLIEKGMVSYIIRENKKFFVAANPENLMNNIRKREAITADLIEELKKIQKISGESQEITVYEGKKGLRTLITEIAKSKIVYSFGATGRLYDTLYESPHLTKEMLKEGMKGKIIFSSKCKNHPFTKFKNIKCRYLDVKSEATTTIFDDKITIHLIKEKPIIIIIKNKLIADSYRAYFEVLWMQAKETPTTKT